MYGAIAREMAEGGIRYLEKPPLYYWLSALTMKLFGPSEWAVRVWSSIPALRSVLLTWRVGRWLYGPAGGLLAGLVLATNIGYFLTTLRRPWPRRFPLW
jgi:4-amino-4-deoxy-L-arabinose transferase-like glycosyltransferase